MKNFNISAITAGIGLCWIVLANTPSPPTTVTYVSDNVYEVARIIDLYSKGKYKVVSITAQPVAASDNGRLYRGRILLVMQKN